MAWTEFNWGFTVGWGERGEGGETGLESHEKILVLRGDEGEEVNGSFGLHAITY